MTYITYQNLKSKAAREISRLEHAEQNQNGTEAQDAALNAAFTVYHLLEWKDRNSTQPTGQGALRLAGNDPDFSMLHNIVTHVKHVQVDRQLPAVNPPAYDVQTSAGILQVPVVVNDLAVMASGNVVVVQQPRLFVKFGTERAVDVLQRALANF